MKYILIILLIFIENWVFSKNTNNDKNILCTPVSFSTEKNSGSGIFLSDDDFIYFVTAGHNIFTRKSKGDSTEYEIISNKAELVFYSHDITTESPSKITIEIDSFYKNNLIEFDNKQDIVVILIGINKIDSVKGFATITYFNNIIKNKPSLLNSVNTYEIASYNDINIGNEILLFGYPSSIGLIDKDLFDYSRPLLRKGVIAGKYEKLKKIIIDCPTYYGNSGGPVYEIKEEIRNINSKIGIVKSHKLIGIVTEYIPYLEYWQNKSNNASNVQTMNSGYSIVTSIDYAINLISDFDIFKSWYFKKSVFHKDYYDNGNIWTEVEFLNGLYWNVLHNNDKLGNPQDKGSLVNGNGTRNIYDEKGNLIMIEFYEKGLLQKVTYK